jgi:predicted lipoprotein with Yx(FWY)xxD motif
MGFVMPLPLKRAARRPRWLLAAPVAAALLAAGCGGSHPSRPGSAKSSRTVAILAKSLPQVGTVLISKQGYTLYMFAPDGRKDVTCTGVCAATWPPVRLPAGAALSAGPGVKSSLLGSDPDPAGGRVVTYAGWPLYTYTGDVQPGQTTGQGIDLQGGNWYVMRPSGAPETTGPS